MLITGKIAIKKDNLGMVLNRVVKAAQGKTVIMS